MSNHNDEKLKQAIDSCTPVAWKYFHGGKWHSGINENNHRENTEAEGFPIRDLCVCKSNKLSQPQDAQEVACDYALSDFKEGQWWVDELDALSGTETATPDQKRAVAVVHNLLRHISAAPQAPAQFVAPEVQQWRDMHGSAWFCLEAHDLPYGDSPEKFEYRTLYTCQNDPAAIRNAYDFDADDERLQSQPQQVNK